jgi:alpha-1,2-mannosyltransferase
VVLFCFLCAAWFVRVTVVNVIPSLGQPSDFSMYYQAAGNVASGHSPFVTDGYIYPPLLAVLLTPLAHLSYAAARWVWYLVSQGCLLLAAGLMWRALGHDGIAACSVALVWAIGGAATESLALGQPGPVLTLLLVLAYTQSSPRHGWLQASAAGLGLAVKLIPGIAGFAFVLRRQWRSLAIFAGVSLLLLALPWLLVTCCLAGPQTPAGTATFTGTPAILSWSLPSVVLRLMDPLTPGEPLPRDWESGNDLPHLRLPTSRRWVSMSVALATLLTGFAVLALHAPAQGAIWFEMAALVSLGLAASPVCWTHYQILQYPGVALLLCHAARSRQLGLFTAALALGALLYPLPVGVLTDYYMKYGKWTASLPTFYFWTSVAPFASLGLFGLLVREARRQHLVND